MPIKRNTGSCELQLPLERDADWRNNRNRALNVAAHEIDEMIDDRSPVSDAARIARAHHHAEPALLLALVLGEKAYPRRKEITVSRRRQPPRLRDLASSHVHRPLVAAVGQDGDY